jgi:hypothetical protein
MAGKGKPMSISFTPEQIMGSNITRNGDNKYASIGIKVGDKEYMNITYEWAGDSIPDFIMSIMLWIQSNKEEIDASKETLKDEYAALKERI